MWSREVDDNITRCQAVGPPVGWRVVCHACGVRGPVMPGLPFSGGAHAPICACPSINHRVHDLRIPCAYCAPEPIP
jgi:hypothetical protein